MLQGMQHIWRQVRERIGRFTGTRPDNFINEIPGLSRASLALSAELGRMRTELEQGRDAAVNELRRLEQQRGEIAAIQDRDANRLTELERRLGEIDDARREAQERVGLLEAALAGAGSRLDSTSQQLAELDDRATQQIRTLEESVGLAVARIEGAEDRSRSMEQRLAGRLDQLATGLQEAGVTQQRLRRRLDWSMTVAAGVLLLGTAAGVILSRDLQVNTRVIAGMRGDMNELLAAIDQRPAAPQPVLPQPAAVAVPPPPVAAHSELPEPAVPPTASDTPPDHPVPPREAPAVSGRHDVDRYFLGRELELFRKTSLSVNPTNRRAPAADSSREPADEAEINTTFSGLQYKVLTAGSGRRPRLTDRVLLDYLGTTEEGRTLVDTYTAGTPVTLLMSELMPGWQEALLLMQEGAEWGLYVPPHLAQAGRIEGGDAPDPLPGFYLIRLNRVIGPPDR